VDIGIKVNGANTVQKVLASIPGKAHRACAVALNKTGKAVKAEEQNEMKSVFDRPTRYTLNSLKLTPATKDNLQAKVWFKDPARMGAHYLVPQVDGGSRKLKGFERAFGEEFVPGEGVRLNQFGNVTGGQIVQIMSVLGKLGRFSGDNSNSTAASRKRNTRERDYVYLPHGSAWGKLPPGIYKRYQTGAGFGAKTKRTFADRSKTYQKGRRRGRFSSVIRARGLKPILIHGRTGHKVKPLLDFYGVANKTFDHTFDRTFWSTLNQFLKS